MIRIVKGSLMTVGAVVVALYLLGTASIGDFALCYGVQHNVRYVCVERGQ